MLRAPWTQTWCLRWQWRGCSQAGEGLRGVRACVCGVVLCICKVQCMANGPLLQAMGAGPGRLRSLRAAAACTCKRAEHPFSPAPATTSAAVAGWPDALLEAAALMLGRADRLWCTVRPLLLVCLQSAVRHVLTHISCAHPLAWPLGTRRIKAVGETVSQSTHAHLQTLTPLLQQRCSAQIPYCCMYKHACSSGIRKECKSCYTDQTNTGPPPVTTSVYRGLVMSCARVRARGGVQARL